MDKKRGSLIQCRRCPQKFIRWYGRLQVLCTDCRYVLQDSVEREMWEAA